MRRWTGAAGSRWNRLGRRHAARGVGAGLAALTALFILPSLAAASALTPGDVVVYRVGTGGATTLGSAGAAVFLDDYNAAGTLVGSVALPTTPSGTTHRLVASGSATSEGLLTLSADARYLIATGYSAAVGASGLTSSASATVPRTVARVDGAGNVDTTTALTDFADGNNPRGATSSDGTNLWVGGAAGGVRYATLGASTSTPVDSTTYKNVRQVLIAGGQLYASGDPTKASPGLTIAPVGSGLPTSGTPNLTDLPFSSGAPNQPYQFAFLTLGSGTAPDVLYVADMGAGAIVKYSLIGGAWVPKGSVAVASVTGVTANDAAGVVTIFATSSGALGTAGTLYEITDASGAGGTLSGTASSIASAPANEAFRGVAFAPGTTIGSGGPPPPVNPTITTSDGVLAASLGDPTNQTVGVTVSDPNFTASQLTVTATSSNTTVAPQAGVSITGTGANRVLALTPAAVGDSTITLTVTAPDSTTTTTTITYGVSANDGDTTDRYYAGAGNGSGEVDVGGGYMVVVDDESNVLRLYRDSTSGLPVKTFDFTSVLPVGTTEADFEAATRVGNTLYWIGSLSNSDGGKSEPSRDILVAATISGSGASTTLTYLGSYTHIREDVIAWDHANGDPLGLTASGASGVSSKEVDGVNLEGMEFAAGSTTTAYLAFRAPLEPPAARASALLVPVTNLASLVTGGNPGTTPATFGTPVEMNLGGLGIRDIRKNADDQYLIVAGTADGSNTSFALYTWDGNPADPPALTTTSLPGVEAGAWEGIVAVPDPLVSGASVELVEDNGSSVWYADGLTTKTGMPVDLQKDLGRTFTIALPGQTVSFSSTAPASATFGGSYAVAASATSGLPVALSIDPSATPGACALAGTTVSFTGIGTCVVDANQGGSVSFAPAAQAQQSFGVGQAAQTVSFTSTPPVGATVGGSYTPAASGGGSGLPVVIAIDPASAAVCSIAGGVVSLAAVGSCAIDANQAGNADFSAASQAQQTLTIGPAGPTAIAGTVTDATGEPLSNVCVYLYDAGTGARTGDVGTCTTAAGTYVLAVAAAGVYKVAFFDPSGNHLTQWSHGEPSEAAADPVIVTTGAQTSGVDAAMTGLTEITGTVTDVAGNPLSNVCVYLYDAPTGARTGDAGSCTGLAGTYVVHVASTGSYKVAFFDPSGIYLTQWSNGEPTEATADAVGVTAGAQATGVNAALARPTQIAGTVKSTSGTPLAGICVYLYAAGSGARTGDPGTCTSPSGTYTLGVAAGGSYKVAFFDPSGTYVTQWSSGEPSEAAADPVTVTTGAQMAGVDATMAGPTQITGVVKDAAGNALANICVYLYDAATGARTGDVGTCTDGTGAYALGVAAGGSYKVAFFDPSGTYTTQWSSGEPSEAAADPVAVTSGSQTTGVNATMTP